MTKAIEGQGKTVTQAVTCLSETTLPAGRSVAVAETNWLM